MAQSQQESTNTNTRIIPILPDSSASVSIEMDNFNTIFNFLFQPSIYFVMLSYLQKDYPCAKCAVLMFQLQQVGFLTPLIR